MYLIFDTETTGLPKNFKAPVSDSDNWPRCVQIAWQIHDEWGELVEVKNYIIKPEGYDIPFSATQIHGISTERAHQQGVELEWVLNEFKTVLEKCEFVVGHNIGFDINIMGAEFYRKNIDSPLMDMGSLDTCTERTAQLCQIPGGRGGKFKLPQLNELHEFLFGERFEEAHNASADVEATTRIFLELIRRNQFTGQELNRDADYIKGFIAKHPNPFELIGLNIQPYSTGDLQEEKPQEKTQSASKQEVKENLEALEDVAFSHLHNHSQFSILQATSTIDDLVKTAGKYKMPGLALTDHGNMMAAFHFVRAVLGYNKGVQERKAAAEEEGKDFDEVEVKPILGCEFFVCKDHSDKKQKDHGYQMVLLAKNKAGYHNLAKMASIAYTEGFYYVPRIDRAVVEQYKDNLICLSGNLYGEIAAKILHEGEHLAEESLKYWKDVFGDDFYLEIMRHGQEDEDFVNKVIVEWSKKYDIKLLATNNTYYMSKKDANAHDVLLCIKEGEKQSTPIGKGRGFRYGFPNEEYYFKSPDEMKELFHDIPEAIINTNEVVDKVEAFDLARDVLLPAFDIPEEFVDPEDEKDGGKRGENAYLRHLTYVGAEKRYGEITDEIRERLDFELATIERTGYPGYFLIVQDFTTASREMGVSVGPGRGSAAGSAVAYCIGITNVDPIAYDLLFERFLNPDRVSLPDIDIDFDDEGRGRVINYVIDKYGANQVAQIITYGTMAAKSAIRDTGRVMDLPLPDTMKLTKLVPDIKLSKLFGLDDKALSDKLKNNGEMIAMANELKKIAGGHGLESQVINQARKIEGSVRNTGIHACGVIITPSDITQYVPVALAKDSKMYCTQFDNSVVEDAGLLKMDFLGLKTLTLIKDACAIVKERHNIDLDPDAFSLEDEKTYELFQRGETVGIFQYESAGMQKYLKELKPTVFADLIAMNALYRPGPLEYIPSFIRRKHGKEEITYDLPEMAEYLEETYGITVYQEQVMLLSQSLAGFTKGEADMLRKAMGKKIFALLEKLKPKFIGQAMEKGHPKEPLEKIWKDWEAFASYAFNKSHSTCYAWVAYQTAWLKAHYPAEYMASVLSNNMNDIKTVTFFMEECRRMGIEVLGPNVNESKLKFTVNQDGNIRFGLGALKGVGGGAVVAIINERKENGPYSSVFDLSSRVDLRACNKKAFESLAFGGAFDEISPFHRAQYFTEDNTGRLFLDTVVRYGAQTQENANSSQVSLFGDSEDIEIPEPLPPNVEEWGTLEKLRNERQVTGIYISGHPLDDYRFVVSNFCNATIGDIKGDLSHKLGKELKFACIVTDFAHAQSKSGKPYGRFTVEDYNDSYEFMLFGDDYVKFKEYMMFDWYLYIKGRIVQKSWGDQRIEFKIQGIDLLSEVLDKVASSITIDLDARRLNTETVQSFGTLLKEYPGKINVKVNVIDPDEGIKVPFLARSVRVALEDGLTKALDDWEGLKYKLN